MKMKVYGRVVNLDGWDGGTAILRSARTEEGKAFRREMGGDDNLRGKGTFRMKEYVPARDGCSNTISTILKDNLLIQKNYG